MSQSRATDLEIADFLIKHIDNPCGIELYPGFTVTIRDFYLREAKKMIGKMTDQAAIKKLQAKVDEYKSP